MLTPVRVFVLYSEKDRKLGLSDDLDTQLTLLKRRGDIVVESEASIAAGVEWQAYMEAGIDRAEIILILVSANLIATHPELVDRALTRRTTSTDVARVIPVLVRPFALEGSPLAALKPLPSEKPVSAWKDQDEAWVAVVRGLSRVIEEVRAKKSQAPIEPTAPSGTSHAIAGQAVPRGSIKKLLLVSANPTLERSLTVNKEFREIADRIQRSKYRDQIDVKMELEIRANDLTSQLLKHQPNILHFSGHGAPPGAILLVDPDHADRTRPVPISALKKLVEVLRDNLRCIVLNACYTAAQEQLIQDLANVVGFAIGMNEEIDDEAALTFGAAFHEALAWGRTLQESFLAAKAQIAVMGVPGEKLPILKSGQGVDPTKFVLVS
jgi:hypothetical protein